VEVEVLSALAFRRARTVGKGRSMSESSGGASAANYFNTTSRKRASSGGLAQQQGTPSGLPLGR
jgi:hypothetical protein